VTQKPKGRWSLNDRVKPLMPAAPQVRSYLSRRQSATTAGAPTDQVRVCLAVAPLTFTTLPVPSTKPAATAGTFDDA
jgi:hypothetical protein